MLEKLKKCKNYTCWLVYILNHMLSEKTTSFPQPFPTRFLQHFPQDFPARISHKIFPQDFPARISHKVFPARIDHKIFPSWILIGWLPITLFQMLNFHQSLLY